MKEKISVSIGIPAYNEEGNIRKLLESLAKQNISSFQLETIYVTLDDCTDNTAFEAKSVKSPKIKIIEHKKRIGQSLRQKELFELNTSDVLVLLNGDVLPSSPNFLKNLISPFITRKCTGIVGGKVTPLPSKTFVEQIINKSVLYKQKMFEKINNGDCLFLCHGRVRAFSKELIKKIIWKPLLNEDAYSYIECKRLGFTFFFESSAEVFYRSPQTLSDHYKQSNRFLIAQKELESIVKKEVLEKNYKIPFSIFLPTTLAFFVRNPIFMIEYLGISFCSFMNSNFNKPAVLFDASKSSKKL